MNPKAPRFSAVGLLLLTIASTALGEGAFTSTGSMAAARYGQSATLLPDGKVLVAGGASNSNARPSAELYDPAAGTWMTTGALTTARVNHTAILLNNGKVLVAGGVVSTDGVNNSLASAELYDPATGTWATTGSLAAGRNFHTATLLENGKVLVAGGNSASNSGSNRLASAELYDPVAGTWTATGSLAGGRGDHTQPC